MACRSRILHSGAGVCRLLRSHSHRTPHATPDKETRDKAVKAVTRYLKNAHDITALELFKVWKALFYCMWHSDKRAVQADLAERLTGLIHVMPPASQPLFVQVFWGTMSREWHGIDRLRCADAAAPPGAGLVRRLPPERQRPGARATAL